MKGNSLSQFSVILLMSSLIGIACKHSDLASRVKVDNGIPTRKFPSVISFDMTSRGGDTYLCSGTFLDSETVLTAAHCLGQESGNDFSISIEGEEPTARYFDPVHYSYDKSSVDYGDSDVAILKVPAAAAQNLGVTTFLKFAQQQPQVGDYITLIGFGFSNHNEQDQTTLGIKRYGHNSIVSIGNQIKFLGTTQSIKESGEFASVDEGDSGSPLLNSNGEIIGVCRGSEFPHATSITSSCVSLTANQRARRILQKAGVKLPKSIEPRPLPKAICNTTFTGTIYSPNATTTYFLGKNSKIYQLLDGSPTQNIHAGELAYALGLCNDEGKISNATIVGNIINDGAMYFCDGKFPEFSTCRGRNVPQ